MNNKIFRHYKEITECEFLDNDKFSRKLVDYYKKYTETCVINDDSCIKKARELDEAMYVYIQDYHFSVELQSKINIDAIIKDDYSYLNSFIDYLISFFEQYNPNKRVKPITRWI